MTIRIGCDPELFIQNTATNRFVSAEDKNGPIIPGTKKHPFEVRGGAIQVDGVAAEFNINPVVDFNGFLGNIKSVITDLNTRVREKNPSYRLRPVPTATFMPKYFFNLPEHTLELGCEPDYSAYTMEANPRPETKEPFRTGSGHIHIGWVDNVGDPNSQGHMLDCQMVVKELDKYLHFASKDWDKDTKRQELYGKPGSFRPKKYGVEYRPLSNSWLQNPNTIRSVFLITMGVVRSLESGNHDFKVDFGSLKNVKSNTDLALNYLGGYVYDL